jgi:uncharacterized protein (TIGR00369 family)
MRNDDLLNTDRDFVLELSKSGRFPAKIVSNPLARELEAEVLELAAGSGRAVLAFDPPARFAQGGAVLQGGIVAALLDFAMAFAAHAQLAGESRGFATAALNVQFLRPAPPARYIARGHIVRAGRKLLFARAELASGGSEGSDGELIATASAVLPLAER